MFVSDVDIVEGLAVTVNMVGLGDAVVIVVAAYNLCPRLLFAVVLCFC